MKSTFTTMLLICSLMSKAQHIKISETDAASHIHYIGTTAEWVNKICSRGFKIALRSEDTAVFVQFTIFPATNGVVASDNELVFQLDNDDIIVAHSKGMQVHISGFNAPTEYRLALEDVKRLYVSSVKSISYTSAGGQSTTFRIEAADKNNMQQVSNTFLNEFQKATATNYHQAPLVIASK